MEITLPKPPLSPTLPLPNQNLQHTSLQAQSPGPASDVTPRTHDQVKLHAKLPRQNPPSNHCYQKPVFTESPRSPKPPHRHPMRSHKQANLQAKLSGQNPPSNQCYQSGAIKTQPPRPIPVLMELPRLPEPLYRHPMQSQRQANLQAKLRGKNPPSNQCHQSGSIKTQPPHSAPVFAQSPRSPELPHRPLNRRPKVKYELKIVGLSKRFGKKSLIVSCFADCGSISVRRLKLATNVYDGSAEVVVFPNTKKQWRNLNELIKTNGQNHLRPFHIDSVDTSMLDLAQ